MIELTNHSRYGFVRAGHVLVAVSLLVSCHSPTRPTTTVASARPLSPATDATVPYYSQPVTLTVAPGLTVSAAAVASIVEVARDAAFTTVVMTKPVPGGAPGDVSVTLDRLNASTTYYWRVSTTTGASPSVVSPASSFTIGPQLLIDAPVVVSPLVNSFPRKRPALTVRNVERTGPPANLAYEFEIARDAGFGAVVTQGTVPEGVQETSFVSPVDLTPGASYFWRARARATTLDVAGEYSPAQAFTTVFPDDGRYRYRLVVRAPSWCLTHFSGSSPCTPPDRWYKSDFGLDVMLVIDGDRLQFALPRVDHALYNQGPLTFDLQRTGNRLTGRASGTTQDVPPSDVTTLSLSGTVTGEGDNSGRFDGSLGGSIALWRSGFPCDKYETCSTADIRWTLLPF